MLKNSEGIEMVIFSNVKVLLVTGLLVLGCSETNFSGNLSKNKKSSSADARSSDLGDVVGAGLPAEYDKDKNGIADFLEDKNGDGYPDGWVDTNGDGVPDKLPEELSEVVGGATGSGLEGLASVTDCDIAKAKGLLSTDTTSVRFEDNRSRSNVCEWDGEDGGRIHGRASWEKSVDFPSSYVICSMVLKSPVSKFYYDDGLLLTLNEKALLWGSVQAKNLDLVDGFRVYNWDRLYRTKISSSHSGCLDGSTVCEVPETQKEGSIALAFNDEVNKKLMKEIESKGAKITLRGFGDNDERIDCTHSELNLEIVYQFFKK